MSSEVQKIYLVEDSAYAEVAGQNGDGHYIVCDKKGNVFEPDYVAVGETDRSKTLDRGGTIIAEFPNENSIIYFGMWLHEGFAKVEKEVVEKEVLRKGYDEESCRTVIVAYRKIFNEPVPLSLK